MEHGYYESYWQDKDAIPDFDPTTPERKRKLAFETARLPKGTALDLGCGRGQFTDFLSSMGYDAVGMDLSANAVASAQKAYPKGQFRQLNSDGTIPSGDSRFDFVWSTEVIEHVFDVSRFLGEVERVLKPGGTFVLTTPYHGVLKNLLICLVDFSRHFDPEGPHVRFFDRTGLNQCLQKAGLVPKRWQGVGRLPWLWRTWFVTCRKPEAISRAA